MQEVLMNGYVILLYGRFLYVVKDSYITLKANYASYTIYNSENSLIFEIENKNFDTDWDSTMSVWVYHTKEVSKDTAIIGIQQYITLNYTNHKSTETEDSYYRLTAQ
jgi:hypothetical protein